MNNQLTAEAIEKQEQGLILTRFNNDDAWELGQIAHDLAKQRGASVTINIEKNGQLVFATAFEGTNPDNERWMAGKRNVVKLFHRSSLAMKLKLVQKQKSAGEAFFVDDRKYLFSGGAIPIRIAQVGIIGSVAVSGLAEEEDHALPADAITELKSRLGI
ncbi:MAG: heme-degrading domain-containing protein [Acetanaerobacterium sp.]